MAIAAFMIAATTIPTHDVLAHSTHTKTVTKADNSQHATFGAGSSGNTATNTPTNTQTQTTNSGTTG